MYSILIRDVKTLQWSYYQTPEGMDFEGTLAEAKAEYIKLLNTMTKNNIKVVHNTIVSLEGMTITDVAE